MVGNLYGDEAAAAGSRPRDWSREDFSSSSTTNFRRESKILSRVEKISIEGNMVIFLLRQRFPIPYRIENTKWH